ncbi:MAG: hypothetical protein HOI95_15660, partial [Chromatiales bacterium]|nr:hypothetical protein [Chromatiales bacterium]
MNRTTALITLTLALIGLTLVSAWAPGRYLVDTQPLFGDGSFGQGVDGWRLSGGRWDSGIVQLAGQGSPVMGLAIRNLTELSDFDFLHVRAVVSGDHLRVYEPFWGAAGIAAHSLDSRGQRLWYWPSRLATLTGNPAWRRIHYTLPVTKDIKSMWLFAYVLSDSQARLNLRALSVHRAHEKLLFKIANYLLIGLWAFAGIAWTAWATRRAQRSFGRYLSIAAAAVVICAGVVPHPHLARGLQWTDSTVASVSTTVALVWVELTTPYTTPQTQPSIHPQPESVAEDEQSSGTPSRSEPTRPEAAQASQPEKAPPPRQPQGPWSYADRSGHAVAFAVLTCISLLAWPAERLTATLLAVLLVSISIQTLQTLIITRDADSLDLALDFMGIVFG